MHEVKLIRKKIIVPQQAILKKQIFKIKRISDKYKIKQYFYEVDDKICLKNIFLENPHPNCNPADNIFCIPSFLKNSKINEDIFNVIEFLIATFNLDNCYFSPWSEIVLDKKKGV